MKSEGLMRELMRGLIAVAVIVALAVPVRAREWNEQPRLGWVFKARNRIVKIIKKTIVTFGDGLSDPKP
jgi:hypothetical protein